jgi:hypothetical protein
VVGLLLLPPVDSNRTRALALGNTYAALSELQYFATPGTQFSARYVEREPPVQDADPPFSRCVLLPLPEETDEAGTRDRTELAGQFLFRDLTSPLGRTADLGREALSALRRESHGLFFQTFGLSQLSWPRHAILKAASRRLCQRIVQRWASKDSKPIREAVQTWVQEQWAQHGLGADQFIHRLQEACQEKLGQAPEKAFAALVENLAKQPEPVGTAAERGGWRPGRGAKAPEPELAPEDLATALEGFEQLIGKPGEESTAEAAGSVGTLLHEASDKLMQAWGQKMAELPVRLIEDPRFRLAGAEEAIRQVMASIEQVLQHYEPLSRDLTTRAAEAYLRLQAALGPRAQGKPSRVGLAATEVLELLRNYPKWRYQSLVLQQVAGAFVSLRGHLSDELREINFCRVRLSELSRLLEEPDADEPADRDAEGKGVGRRLYPSGCKNLSEAVDQFLAEVSAEDLVELDFKMEGMLKKQFTALVTVCLNNSHILKNVERYMLTTAYEFAALRGAETSVAELFLQQNADPEQAAKEVAAFFREAAAKLSPAAGAEPPPGAELCILATPPGEAGNQFRDLVHGAVTETPLQDCCSVTADDILIYREHPTVPLTTLEHFGPLGEDTYRQMTATEHFTPHTRIDVQFRKR